MNETPNRVHVVIQTELGCDLEKGEFGIWLANFDGMIDIDGRDIDLIRECIQEHIDDLKLPAEGWFDVFLIESGEWEDVFWNKYYILASEAYQ